MVGLPRSSGKAVKLQNEGHHKWWNNTAALRLFHRPSRWMIRQRTRIRSGVSLRVPRVQIVVRNARVGIERRRRSEAVMERRKRQRFPVWVSCIIEVPRGGKQLGIACTPENQRNKAINTIPGGTRKYTQKYWPPAQTKTEKTRGIKFDDRCPCVENMSPCWEGDLKLLCAVVVSTMSTHQPCRICEIRFGATQHCALCSQDPLYNGSTVEKVPLQTRPSLEASICLGLLRGKFSRPNTLCSYGQIIDSLFLQGR